MVFEVVVTRSGARDIGDTVDFLAPASTVAAIRWLEEITSALESLRELPLRAARIPEKGISRFEHRQLVCGSHRIVFRVDKAAKKVFVVRVYHSSRGPLSSNDLPLSH